MSHEKHRPDIETADSLINYKRLSQDLAKLLNEKSIVLDIGANNGQFAKHILEIAKVERIYSFEPVPNAYLELERFSDNNPQVIPICKAVSTNDGTSKLFVTKSDVGSSLLQPIPNQPSKWLNIETCLNVKTTRLDTFINKKLSKNKSISLLKSDAQGADICVLRSAGEYLSPAIISAILVELNFTTFYVDQNNYYEILSLLDDAGYRLAWLYPYRSSDEWIWWADALFIGKNHGI